MERFFFYLFSFFFFQSLISRFFPFLLFLSLFVRAVSLCGHLSVATVSDDNQTLVVVRPCHRHLASFFTSIFFLQPIIDDDHNFSSFSFFLLDVIPSPWITRDCYPWSTDAAAAVVVFLSSPTTAA
jgi:hypothetical protein